MKRSLATQRRKLEDARKRTAAQNIYQDDAVPTKPLFAHIMRLDDLVLLRILEMVRELDDADSAVHAHKPICNNPPDKSSPGPRFRPALALTCLRFYYLQRTLVKTIRFSVPMKIDRIRYNDLVMRYQAGEQWQQMGRVWTVMAEAQTVELRLGINVYTSDIQSSVMRAQLPFYYLQSVTTAEQRAEMTLELRAPYSNGPYYESTWRRQAQSLLTLGKPKPVSVATVLSFGTIEILTYDNLLVFLIWCARHQVEWPERKPKFSVERGVYTACWTNLNYPNVAKYARRLGLHLITGGEPGIYSNDHGADSSTCRMCKGKGAPFTYEIKPPVN